MGERLAACVNQFHGIRSTYGWHEAVHGDSEELLLINTTTARLAALERRLVELHRYDVPVDRDAGGKTASGLPLLGSPAKP